MFFSRLHHKTLMLPPSRVSSACNIAMCFESDYNQYIYGFDFLFVYNQRISWAYFCACSVWWCSILQTNHHHIQWVCVCVCKNHNLFLYFNATRNRFNVNSFRWIGNEPAHTKCVTLQFFFPCSKYVSVEC